MSKKNSIIIALFLYYSCRAKTLKKTPAFECTVISSLYFFYQCTIRYREGLSTSNAIIKNLQFVYDNLDKGDMVLSIFLDLRKAFDCVYHKILLSKLSMYRIRGVALD